MAPGPESVRLGLVGAGRWGRNYISTINRLSGVELSALVSSSPEAVALAGPDCRCFSGWREMLDWSSLDGIVLAVPPIVQTAVALEALDRGLGVLLEKPVALCPDEASSLLEKARAAGVPVLVDHIHLYSPAYQALKAHLRELGLIRSIRGRAGNWGPFRHETPVLWDWGPHDVAMCLDLVGVDPVAVNTRLLDSWEDAPGPHAQRISMIMDFPGGVRAECVVSNIDEAKTRKLEVEAGDFRLVLDDLALDKLTAIPLEGGDAISMPHGEGAPLDTVVQAFARALSRGRADIADLELGARVVGVLDSLDRDLKAKGD